jgi:hypothetical protein
MRRTKRRDQHKATNSWVVPLLVFRVRLTGVLGGVWVYSTAMVLIALIW